MVLGFLDGSRNFDRSTASLGASLALDVTFPSLMMSFHFSASSSSDLPSISILTTVQVPSSSANFFSSGPPAPPAVKAPTANVNVKWLTGQLQKCEQDARAGW